MPGFPVIPTQHSKPADAGRSGAETRVSGLRQAEVRLSA